MRFKKSPQLPGAGRTRAWHHHGSHTPTSSGAVLLGKKAYHTKQICRECTFTVKVSLIYYIVVPITMEFILAFEDRALEKTPHLISTRSFIN